MDQAQAQAPDQTSGDDAVIDQIGELMQQLPPEKQAQVISKLQELLEPEAPQEVETVSPEGGPSGQPVRM